MLYSRQIKFTHGKTEAEATKTPIKVNKGVIYQVWVDFPPGCAGLVKLRVYHEGHPFLPVNKDNYLRGNAYVYKLPVYHEVRESPSILIVEGWNEDDTYDHTIQVVFSIIPKWIAYPYIMLTQIMEGFTKLFI